MKRSIHLWLSALALGALLTSGCMSIRLGAPHSLNPVMLGPKKHLGPERDGAEAESRAPTVFRASSNLFSASDGAGSSAASASSTIENAMDIDVAVDSRGNVFDVFVIEQIDCNGWGAFYGFFVGAGNKCIAAVDRIERRPPPR